MGRKIRLGSADLLLRKYHVISENEAGVPMGRRLGNLDYAD
jgi:hypothetical protein